MKAPNKKSKLKCVSKKCWRFVVLISLPLINTIAWVSRATPQILSGRNNVILDDFTNLAPEELLLVTHHPPASTITPDGTLEQHNDALLTIVVDNNVLSSSSRNNNKTVLVSAAAPLKMLNNSTTNDAEDDSSRTEQKLDPHHLSSVDYRACCGLGHRIGCTANAYFVATRVLNFSLRTFWGFCNGRKEVFRHLFSGASSGGSLLPTPRTVTSIGKVVAFNNRVVGYRKLFRERQEPCVCADRAQYDSDVEFYTTLQQQFRLKRQVDKFVKDKFSKHSVIGIHVRGGNSERGNFAKKGRAIGVEDADEWVAGIVKQIRSVVANTTLEKPPLLYIATDTPSMIDAFTKALKGDMPVQHFPQHRSKEGEGVLLGSGAEIQTGDCLQNWESVAMDMILLSHADLIIAARPSSFSQTMPMMMSYNKTNRIFAKNYCEVNFNATDIVCYGDFMEWCCEGLSTFPNSGMSQRYEFIRVPIDSTWNHDWGVKNRPDRLSLRMRNTFLPLDFITMDNSNETSRM